MLQSALPGQMQRHCTGRRCRSGSTDDVEGAGARYTTTHPDVTFNIVDFAKADVEQKL